MTRSVGLGLGPYEGGDNLDARTRLDGHPEDQPDIPHKKSPPP